MSHKFTPEQMAKFEYEFKLYDKNGDGRITVKDMIESQFQMSRLDANNMVLLRIKNYNYSL